MIRILITILLAGGGIFLLRSYVQPELADVQRIRTEQAVVSDAISNAREVIRLRDELLARYNSISPADIDKIRKFLPAGSAISELFIDIDTMIIESGITVTKIAFEENATLPAETEGGAQALTVTLAVEGTYEQFRSLLSIIEKNIRLIDVVGLTLQKPTDAPIGFEIVLRSYYQQRTIL